MSKATQGWSGIKLAGGRYQITHQLGEGGMGLVYLAWDNNLGTEVVIKVPRRALLGDDQFVRRFPGEVRSLVRLNHPHIVKVLDVGEHEGLPFAVMQYLSGRSLKDRQPVADGGRPLAMPPQVLKLWLEEIASALDFIHGQHYVHRDIKPANILFDAHDNPYLSDFGVAKALAAMAKDDQASSFTATGMVFGTPGYMAPEMIVGLPFNGLVDQYALAATVYELLAGQGPFEGLALAAIAIRQNNDQILPLCQVTPSISKQISAVIHKALAREPAHRFPNCTAFAQALLKAAGEGGAAPRETMSRLSHKSRQDEPLFGLTTSFSRPCPACRKVMLLSPDMAGDMIRCPTCNVLLEVPQSMQHLIIVQNPPKQDGYIRLLCPRCKKRIKLLPRHGGKRVRCADCSASLMVNKDCSAVYDPPVAKPAQPARVEPTRKKPVDTETGPTSVEATRIESIHSSNPGKASRVPRQRKQYVKVFCLLLLALLVLGGAAGGLWYFLKPHNVLPQLTHENAITGTMVIDFLSRTTTGKARAADIYEVNLSVRLDPKKRIHYGGSIFRKLCPKDKEEEEDRTESLQFNLNVMDQPLDAAGQSIPSKESHRGKITGFVPLKEGCYLFEKNLKWTDNVGQFNHFKGQVQGKKGEKGETQKSKFLDFDTGDGQKQSYEVKAPDPLIFHSLNIPGDNLDVRTAKLTGELSYSYENYSYFTNDLRFSYDDNATDHIQGTIIWVTDPVEYLQGKTENEMVKGGKSKYMFTLIFNVKSNPSTKASGKSFEGDKQDLIKIDNSMSTLTGTIDYEDDGKVEKDKRGRLAINPVQSRVSFHLHANRLNEDQVHNFLKMWLLMSGPVNDE